MRFLQHLMPVAALTLSATVAGAQVNVNVYPSSTNLTNEGDGSSLITGAPGCTMTASSIHFNFLATPPSCASTGYNFAAQITGIFSVPTTGSYSFYEGSDDGSSVYIDGTQELYNGNDHGEGSTTFSDNLTAGSHSVLINYYANYYGSSSLDFDMNGSTLTYNTPTTTPEPSSLALLGTGLVGLVPLIRRKAKR